MGLLFPRRILIALIVHVMSGIVRFLCLLPPSPTLLCIIATQTIYLPGLILLSSNCFVAETDCIFLICLTFVQARYKAAHTSEEISPMLWVSRLSSAGIHVPIISTMRIIVLRKVVGIQSEHNFSYFIQ